MIPQLFSLLLALVSTLSFSMDAITDMTSTGGMLALVNREYLISEEYEPDDLIKPNVSHTSSAILMREEAAHALEALFAAAREEAGITLYAASGYRSYSTQELIYQRKIKSTGSEAKAQLLVAPPGASEHQLGLAMDLKADKNSGLSSAFAKTRAGQWVAENAHRFGFIIRYKEEWSDITGYSYEPWHIRYVGVEHAQIIYEMDIPLEEYIEALRLVVISDALEGE